jgi:ATP-binding cassette subfamily F protein 3
MVYIENISLTLGERKLLDKISFVLNDKERVALVGRNGAGKSTLLKIIAGIDAGDTGKINSPKEFTTGYLRQDLHFENNLPLIDEVKTCFKEYNALSDKLLAKNEELANRTDYETNSYSDLLIEISEINDRLVFMSSGNIEADIEKVLKGLGFTPADYQKRMREFSGGWQMRVELAKLLLQKPNLLMLDEPTNHLDMDAIIWLEQYLSVYPGIVLIISHDKRFLDNVSTKTIELELGKANEYSGNYSFYLREKENQKEILLNSYNNQQKLLAQKEKTINRFMAKATKTSMAQSMQKQLDKIERIEIPEEDDSLVSIKFPKAPHCGNVVLEVKHVSQHFGNKIVLNDVNFILEKGDRIGFVGQNGMGKTTMAKIINSLLKPSSGDIKLGANVAISYFAQNQAELIDTRKTVLEVMEDNAPAEQRPKVRSILGAFLFSGDDVEKKVSVLSGGERARLAMAIMMMRPGNLLILDEPTNHLDMQSKDILKQAIMSYDGSLIVVSHDREFLEGLTDKTFEFINQNVTEHLGDINYFLERKKFSDVRDIDTATQSILNSKTETPSNVVSTLNHEELKKMKRRLQYLERDIENAEKTVMELSDFMADPASYMKPEFSKNAQKLKETQHKLDIWMEEWEALAEQLSSYA